MRVNVSLYEHWCLRRCILHHLPYLTVAQYMLSPSIPGLTSVPFVIRHIVCVVHPEPSKILQRAGPGAQLTVALVRLLMKNVYLTGWSANVYRTAYQLAILCVSLTGTQFSLSVSRNVLVAHTIAV
jgi:hypothetical protein